MTIASVCIACLATLLRVKNVLLTDLVTGLNIQSYSSYWIISSWVQEDIHSDQGKVIGQIKAYVENNKRLSRTENKKQKVERIPDKKTHEHKIHMQPPFSETGSKENVIDCSLIVSMIVYFFLVNITDSHLPVWRHDSTCGLLSIKKILERKCLLPEINIFSLCQNIKATRRN